MPSFIIFPDSEIVGLIHKTSAASTISNSISCKNFAICTLVL